jgi:predicted TIM-barrel fold metal-dependent hydrolase
MSETRVVARSTGHDTQQVTLVDCDIHPLFPSFEGVYAFLSDSTREHVRRHGRSFAGWAAHCWWGMNSSKGGGRVDAVFQEGESPLDLVRRQVIDLYGIDYGVLNLAANFFDRNAPEIAADGARAENEWLVAEFLAQDPRLLGTLIVPWEQPALAVAEIERRASERWWAQVAMPSEAMEPLGARKYWPIYEAATGHGFPVAAHVGHYDHHHATGWPSYSFERHFGLGLAMRRQLLNLVCEGLFEAVPGVRIVLVEGGVGWTVSLRWALDSAFELLGSELSLQRTPSEYLDEHVWFSTQPVEEPDDPAQFCQMVEQGNLASRLMFATDWPHWDFDSPTQALPRSLPVGTRERIFAGNACALYGLPR